MTKLEEYYNKFNEEKRLNSRHGNIEFEISMKYIHKYLKKGDRIADIGAGTGRYSIPLFEEGYDVVAVEPVQHNLGRLKQKNQDITAYKGNALKLKRIETDSIDFTIFFGPMYHLHGDDRLRALLEAKRITRPGGIIMVAYIMNEYGILTYGFKERNVISCIETGEISEEFHIVPGPESLYDFVRIEDIDRLNEQAGLDRELIFSPDGPANHMRYEINQLTEQEYRQFVNYQMSVCERPDLLGASAHTVDVLRVPINK